MNEENLKKRLQKELDYAKEKITQTTKDIQLMLDGFDKECFNPVCNIIHLKQLYNAYLELAVVCNIIHLKQLYNAYLELAVSLSTVIRDIGRRESD